MGFVVSIYKGRCRVCLSGKEYLSLFGHILSQQQKVLKCLVLQVLLKVSNGFVYFRFHIGFCSLIVGSLCWPSCRARRSGARIRPRSTTAQAARSRRRARPGRWSCPPTIAVIAVEVCRDQGPLRRGCPIRATPGQRRCNRLGLRWPGGRDTDRPGDCPGTPPAGVMAQARCLRRGPCAAELVI
jgi:hypothetical protein